MSYWTHTLLGLGLIAVAVCALRQARELKHLRDINADLRAAELCSRAIAETARERSARRNDGA